MGAMAEEIVFHAEPFVETCNRLYSLVGTLAASCTAAACAVELTRWRARLRWLCAQPALRAVFVRTHLRLQAHPCCRPRYLGESWRVGGSEREGPAWHGVYAYMYVCEYVYIR